MTRKGEIAPPCTRIYRPLSQSGFDPGQSFAVCALLLVGQA